MKRDFDLIRKIMMEAQELDPNCGFVRFKYEEEDNRSVIEHCALLINANLLEGRITKSDAGIIHKVEISRITWEGHDFIASMKNDTIWNKAKSTLLGGATGITFSLLQKWLENQAFADVGIH